MDDLVNQLEAAFGKVHVCNGCALCGPPQISGPWVRNPGQHRNRGMVQDRRWHGIAKFGGVPIPIETGWHVVDQSQIMLLWNDFPDIDVLQQLIKMRRYLKANPNKRPPRNRMKGRWSYVYHWMDRASNHRHKP